MEDPGLEKPLGLVTAGYTLSSRPTDILQRGWSSQRWQKGAFFDYLDLHGVLVAQPPGRIKGGAEQRLNHQLSSLDPSQGSQKTPEIRVGEIPCPSKLQTPVKYLSVHIQEEEDSGRIHSLSTPVDTRIGDMGG